MSTRHSPAVSLRLRRPWGLFGVCAALGLAAALVLLVWSWQGAGQPGLGRWLRLGLAWGSWSVGLLLAWEGGRRLPQSGWLRWDGQAWAWETHTAQRRWPMGPEVLLDLQQAMLLVFRPAAEPAQYFWLSRSWSPGEWLALRRAVYSSANPGEDATDR